MCNLRPIFERQPNGTIHRGRQLRVCNEYAKNNDILVLNTYIDRAMTGTNDHRPSFQNMIKDSHRKEWDYVLVYKLDRFSRNKYETAIHKKTLRDNGVKILSAMEKIPDTPEGIILESMLEGFEQILFNEWSFDGSLNAIQHGTMLIDGALHRHPAPKGIYNISLSTGELYESAFEII